MVKNQKYHIRLIETLYNKIPSFTDLFDEDTFLLFVGCFVATTIAIAFILSRFIKLRPVDW